MKAFKYGLTGCILVSCILFLTSCFETEDPTKKPNDLPPPILDREIVASFYPTESEEILVRDSIRVFFNEADSAEQLIGTRYYRAIIDEVSIEGVVTTKQFAANKLSVTVYPVDMLEPNASFTVSVKAHWELKTAPGWVVVTWEDQDVRQTVTHEVSTAQLEIELREDNIKSLYPIPNQYHFLIDEHPTCFIQLKRGQKAMFESSTHTYRAIFTTGGISFEEPASYDEDKKTITFNRPEGLETQTIYKLKFVAREASTDNVLLEYHFRTSKYKTFSEKFNTLTFREPVFRILVIPWRGHVLSHFITDAGEYFDSFESETKIETITIGQAYAIPYATNLVRFEAELEGTEWYDEQLYPMLYAPWSDADFKPTVTRDTTGMGYPPVRAMSFSRMGSGQLTAEMITNNNAPAIAPGSSPSVDYSLANVLLQDFQEIQAQVVLRYVDTVEEGDREHPIIWSLIDPIPQGTYPYKIKYTLPSGEVTTVIQKSMSF